MTDATTDAPDSDGAGPKKSSKLPLIIGLVLALIGGGGGFFVAFTGMLPFGGGGAAQQAGDGQRADSHAEEGADHSEPFTVPDTAVAFVELPPLVISMGTIADLHHLRFQASIEVRPQHLQTVTDLQPRIMDVLNSYLRALRPADIEAPGALISIRSQILRRLQLVAGEDRVRDLLIIEFVLN